jgi:hypothetical protein
VDLDFYVYQRGLSVLAETGWEDIRLISSTVKLKISKYNHVDS